MKQANSLHPAALRFVSWMLSVYFINIRSAKKWRSEQEAYFSFPFPNSKKDEGTTRRRDQEESRVNCTRLLYSSFLTQLAALMLLCGYARSHNIKIVREKERWIEMSLNARHPEFVTTNGNTAPLKNWEPLINVMDLHGSLHVRVNFFFLLFWRCAG